MHCVGKVLKNIFSVVANPLRMGQPSHEQSVLPFGTPATSKNHKVLDGRFCITGKLGEGANGLVFSAVDLHGGPHVAIKISNPDNKESSKLLKV
jgi:hypothetical protein